MRMSDWSSDVCSSDREGGARGGEVVDEVDVVKAGAYAQFVLQILGKALPLLVIDVHHRDDLFLRKASGVCAAQHVDPATITQPDEQATAKATLESGSAFDRPPHQIGRASCRERVCQYV